MKKNKFPLQPEEEDNPKNKRKKPKRLTMSVRDAKALAQAKRYLSVLQNQDEALALWELLWYKLPKQNIDIQSLEMTLQKKEENNNLSLSV